MKKIKFSSPDISLREFISATKVLASGWLTTGKKVIEFEDAAKNYLNLNQEKYAIAINSATAGLHLSLEAIGLKKNDEVITTVLTFTATAEVITYFGANPVFCDIDPKTLNIDLKKAESLITPKTKAILPVHFAGNACDIDYLFYLKKKYGIHIIEDAAHALSSSYKNKPIGSHGLDSTVFSFYANKNITSGGEGGMIIVNNKKIAERIRTMSLHGINKIAYDRYTNPSSRSWDYDVVDAGYKYNLTDLAASIGLAQIKRLSYFHKKRIKLAKLYDYYLSDLPIILPPRDEGIKSHSWHLYVIQVDKRNEIIDNFTKNNIGFSLHYKPLNLHSYWKNKFSLRKENFPFANDYYQKALSLPLHTKMKPHHVKLVCNIIKKVLIN